MDELQHRIEAPRGLVVSGTGSSRPIPVRRAGKALVAGFLYQWFPAPEGGGKVHLVSPERLYVLDPVTGDVLSEEGIPDGGRPLGPAGAHGAPEKAAFEAMDRLFVAFARDQPCKGDLERDAVTYRASFERSTDPLLVPYHLRIGADWFPWVLRR
jgi:hypothetical protein